MTAGASEAVVSEPPPRALARQQRRTKRRRVGLEAGVVGTLTGLATVIVAFAALDNVLFRDEAVTADVATRSLPQILDLLGTIDAAHALLYLVVGAVPLDAGSAVQLRLVALLPVAVAGGVLAGWSWLRLGPAAGLLTGVAWPILPTTVAVGTYARDYGLATLFAVLASLLLIELCSGSISRRSAWIAYVVVIALLGWSNLFALLLLPAHAAAVVHLRRSGGSVSVSQWMRWAALGAAGALPIAVVALRQPTPINWVAPPLVEDLWIIPVRILGGSGYGTNEAPDGAVALAVLLALLAAAGIARTAVLARRAASLEIDAVEGPRAAPAAAAAVAAYWLLVPLALAVLVSLAQPMFVARYLWFIAPAAVLALGLLVARPAPGSEGEAERVGLASSRVTWGVAVLVAAGLLVATAGPRGTILETQGAADYPGVARVLATQAEADDAIVVDDPSYLFARAGIEQALGGPLPVADVWVAVPADVRGNVAPLEVPPEDREAALEGRSRVWVLTGSGVTEPLDGEQLAAQDRRLLQEDSFGELVLRLYG